MDEYKRVQKILDSYKAKLQKNGPNWPQKVKQAVKFIHNNIYAEELNVKLVKQECKINNKAFSSVFSKHLKHYPKDYILYHRLRISKKLLLTVDTSITFIAHSVGFNSLSSFCKTFKRKEGLNPSEWKEKLNR